MTSSHPDHASPPAGEDATDAAQAQIRQRRLRAALDALASEEGELDPAEIDELIARAQRTSQVVIGAEGAA